MKTADELTLAAKYPLLARAHASGETYSETLDQARLSTQLLRVYRLLSDSDKWYTLREIADAIGGGSEAGISARLRDLRKPQFGSFIVDRRRRGEPKAGCWEYRLLGGAQ
jgi:hypothetical protein